MRMIRLLFVSACLACGLTAQAPATLSQRFVQDATVRSAVERLEEAGYRAGDVREIPLGGQCGVAGCSAEALIVQTFELDRRMRYVAATARRGPRLGDPWRLSVGRLTKPDDRGIVAGGPSTTPREALRSHIVSESIMRLGVGSGFEAEEPVAIVVEKEPDAWTTLVVQTFRSRGVNPATRSVSILVTADPTQRTSPVFQFLSFEESEPQP